MATYDQERENDIIEEILRKGLVNPGKLDRGIIHNMLDDFLNNIAKDIQVIYDEILKEDTESMMRSIRDFDMKIMPTVLDMVRCLLTINDTDALITYMGIADHINNPDNKMLPRIIIYLERKYSKEEYPDLHIHTEKINKIAHEAIKNINRR